MEWITSVDERLMHAKLLHMSKLMDSWTVYPYKYNLWVNNLDCPRKKELYQRGLVSMSF